jgi:hypothetical protein
MYIFTFLVSRDTFVPTKIVLKVDFLERDHFWRKKATGQKWAKKYTVCKGVFMFCRRLKRLLKRRNIFVVNL